jgi:hypothetical protein
MSGRWSITLRSAKQRVFPFDHQFELHAPGCDCSWLARSIDAAIRLVDRAEFLIAHPELESPKGDVGQHVRHVQELTHNPT